MSDGVEYEPVEQDEFESLVRAAGDDADAVLRPYRDKHARLWRGDKLNFYRVVAAELRAELRKREADRIAKAHRAAYAQPIKS